mmetsp:Transcript_17183/g.29584  ORF Transcript_17183/g.29584 Transcript_17183/m.29584 type:complete len:326 (+) Transcript_17183:51-1028(+)
MNRDATPASASANVSLAVDNLGGSFAVDDACNEPIITTPKNITPSSLGEQRTTITPVKSTCCHGAGPASSCKRRRLASEDDENNNGETPINYASFGGSARKLNYERNYDSDTSEDSDEEDPIDQEIAQMKQESILKKIQRLNYEGTDQLVHTAAYAKLFEYVKDKDDVSKNSSVLRQMPKDDNDASKKEDLGWKYRGSGNVKFIKCMEEGYNCGMIRLELTKNGTLDTLMCHELIHEEVMPMPSKKGKAYTWRCKDWAYMTAVRTFAIRFEDDMDALSWKSQLEQSKTNNQRVRRGLDIPDVSAVDDVCSSLQNLSTTQSSPSQT